MIACIERFFVARTKKRSIPSKSVFASDRIHPANNGCIET
jgi:hypothetical protein